MLATTWEILMDMEFRYLSQTFLTFCKEPLCSFFFIIKGIKISVSIIYIYIFSYKVKVNEFVKLPDSWVFAEFECCGMFWLPEHKLLFLYECLARNRELLKVRGLCSTKTNAWNSPILLKSVQMGALQILEQIIAVLWYFSLKLVVQNFHSDLLSPFLLSKDMLSKDNIAIKKKKL